MENQHHLFFNKSYYKSRLEKQFRTHSALVIPMELQVHRDLHAEVPPPPKPSARLIYGAIGALSTLDTFEPVNTVLTLSEHFLSIDNNLAHRIGHNLLMQAGYIQRSEELLTAHGTIEVR